MMPGPGPFLAWLAFMHGLTLWFLWPCAHFSDFSTSCRNKVSMNTLPGIHACISGFSAWVHSKTIFTRFHIHSAGGWGGFKRAILQKPIWKQDLHPQGPLPWCQDLAHFLLGLLLCMGWPCDSYGPVHTFQTFQLQFFFRKFFLGPLYGALHCLQNIFHEGGFFVEPLKKHDYKEALVTKIARFSRKTNKNRSPCDFSLGFTISRPWIHMLQKRNLHWISMWRPWCEKLNSQPRSHAGTRCPWTRFLEFMHAFQDSVPEFIQKRFSPDFISTVQGGRVV